MKLEFQRVVKVVDNVRLPNDKRSKRPDGLLDAGMERSYMAEDTELTKKIAEAIKAIEAETVYQLTEPSLQRVNDRLEEFNKKARKLGFPEAQAQVHGIYLSPVYQEGKQWDGATQRVNLTTITYPHNVVIAGWTFVATIEPLGEGNIINHAPGFDGNIPEKYRTANLFCDHCRTDRYRLKVFILTNGADWKQVGSTCLKDFLGHGNPEGILSYIEALQACKQDLEADTLAGDDYPLGDRGMSRPSIYRMDTYLANVAAIAEKYGYYSKGRAQAAMVLPTSQAALENMWSDNGKRTEITEAHQQMARDMLTWAREYYRAKYEDRDEFKDPIPSDYEFNMYLLTKYGISDRTESEYNDYFETSKAGYLSSIYPQFLANRPHEDDGWFGEKGQKLDLTGRVVSVLPMDGQYGTYYITKFQVDNCLAVAFMNKRLEADKDYSFKDVEILEHSDYRGEKQTKVKINMRLKVNRAQI